jgi:hypothetical protein
MRWTDRWLTPVLFSAAAVMGGAGCSGGSPATADGAACAFDDTYRYGPNGGLVAYSDESTLAPPDRYQHVRTFYDAATPRTATCAPALPPCGAQGVISASDVMRALASSDVQAAFAEPTPMFFGVDRRPVDGPAYAVKRSDGRGLLVGDPCGPPAVDCRAIPPGVQALVDLLKMLDQQQLAMSACAALK